MRFRTLLAGAVTVLAILTIAPMMQAQDVDKGGEAYRRGDLVMAFREWNSLAQQGDANAQFKLGHMYEWGNGIPKDKRYPSGLPALPWSGKSR